MPLLQCPTCDRFFKSPAGHQGQALTAECPGCRAVSRTSPATGMATPRDEPATPRDYRSVVLFLVAALIGPVSGVN